MATGALGFMGISKQNSFGTATASWTYTPFVSETLVHRIDKLPVLGIRNSLIEGGAMPGLDRAEGDIVVEPDPVAIGYFLRGLLGVPSSTTINTAAGIAQHTFNMKFTDWTQKSPTPCSTIEMWRGVEEKFQFQDVVFPRMTLNIDANALVRATFATIGRVVSLTTYAAPDFSGATEKPWTWAVCSVSINDAAPEVYESLALVVDNALEGVVLLDATRRFNRYGRTDRPTIRFSGRLDLQNLDEYDRFVAQSTVKFLVNLATHQNSSENGTLTIDFPSFQYDSIDPQIGGPGRISVDWTGRALYNTGSGTAMTITLCNTKHDYVDLA